MVGSLRGLTWLDTYVCVTSNGPGKFTNTCVLSLKSAIVGGSSRIRTLEHPATTSP
jgi:hypothetical protein